MENLANTEVGDAADVASQVAESVSTGDQRLLDDDDDEFEMTADELAEFEARLLQEEAEEAAEQQPADVQQLPTVAPEAGIPAPAPDTDTNLPAGLVARLKRKVTTMTTSNAQAAGNNPAVPQRSQYQTTRDAAMGLSPVPPPLNPDGSTNLIGMAYAGKGEAHAEIPWPDRENGVALVGKTLTDILRAHPEFFAAYGLDEDLLTKLNAEVATEGPVIHTELAVGDKFHPTNNPDGFPCATDRTIRCTDFLALKCGLVGAGCDAYCRTFITKNPPRKWKVAVGCSLSRCPGYRDMSHPTTEKGAPGMYLASRYLTHLLVGVLSTTMELTYELRLQKCSNLLLLHSTLVTGWLRYEAYLAHKESALQEQYRSPSRSSSLTGTTSKGGRGRVDNGRCQSKGRGKNGGKSTHRPSASTSAPRGSGRSPSQSGGHRTPLLSRGTRIGEQPRCRSESTLAADSPSGSRQHGNTNPSRTELYEQFRREKRAKRG